ncbi:MAG: DUF5615 family PIN-like protein [bacterium]|nr:DUF5615 family PIN-like protein [bacterium]
MRFLADVGIGARVVGWLKDNGHDATHLSEEGLQRLPNGEIFDKGIAERRVILTFDLDFGEIAALSGGGKASVVVFRLHNTRSDHVIARLSVVLEESMSALETGAVVVVEESRHRIRYLPIIR